MLETDLYAPVKRFLTELDYEVRGEVNGCDVVAVKHDELLVVELKKSFTLTLLYQALDRQSMTDQVYVAVPRPVKNAGETVRRMKKILKKLELGLMLVALDSPLQLVEVPVFPVGGKKIKNKDGRQALLDEIAGRRTDGNTGGSSRTKLITAYRERAIQIACILEKKGSLSAKDLVNIYGCEKDASSILRGNYYGWFDKVGRGLYTVNTKGSQALEEDSFAELAAYYRQL